VDRALESGARLHLSHDPEQAVAGVDYINTDAWFSMGQEDEEELRQQAFQGFQVNAALLAKAGPKARVLHCLPAHRGQEITEEIIEGQRSLVWEQAVNRLHMQKAILEWIYGG
jgi:ornithine carbamoyltransferase